MGEYVFTILGCGSSGGVPRIGGNWGDCDPNNPKNARQRCSMLVERISAHGKTSVLIDTSPDLRRQLLDAKVTSLDAVVYTHDHADHVHGIDDLRMLHKRLPVWADASTQATLLKRFGYAFEQIPGTLYKPILKMNHMDGPVTIGGAGGMITLVPFLVDHGPIKANGFRIDNLAYLPDVSAMNDAAWQAVSGLDCWVVDALRRDPHPTHSHLAQTLDWIDRAAPKRAVLTNMHVDLDYDTLQRETPDHITPAFDGMQISLPA